MARVLVVEDNRDNLDLMTFLLEAFGHEPIGAMSGARAIEIVADVKPDVVLLDIQMPEMDGFETAAELRRNRALDDVPLIAVTALAMAGDREMILGAGFAGYIAKPVDPARLPEQLAASPPVNGA